MITCCRSLKYVRIVGCLQFGGRLSLPPLFNILSTCCYFPCARRAGGYYARFLQIFCSSILAFEISTFCVCRRRSINSSIITNCIITPLCTRECSTQILIKKYRDKCLIFSNFYLLSIQVNRILQRQIEWGVCEIGLRIALDSNSRCFSPTMVMDFFLSSLLSFCINLATTATNDVANSFQNWLPFTANFS